MQYILHYSGSSHTLLQQLSSLTGLVFLQDDTFPVMAFLPQDYWLVQHNTAYYHQRQADFSYICTQQQTDYHQTLLTWQQFDSQGTHQLEGFTGGYIGFVSYDEATDFHLKQRQQPIRKHPQPSLFLGCYRSFIRIQNHQIIFYSDESNAQDILNHVITLIDQPLSLSSFRLNQPFTTRWKKDQYQQAFNQVQQYIMAGDCYQINLTQEFIAQSEQDLLAIAPQLWQYSQAPFSGYVKIHDFELLSCSPELFIEWTQANLIKTRPIKGTMPRHADPHQDAINREILQKSTKDQAENIMIVDLLRNDLSIYAQIGSVKTTQLFEIESFSQVHHLVSEIQAQLKPIHPYQMLMTALPGGSITGAPKIRAMQIINELEQNTRGCYCGSLGYFNFNGTGRWNILIRTLQKYQHHISLWAGGGITIASNADAEYQECFDKIGGILAFIHKMDEDN